MNIFNVFYQLPLKNLYSSKNTVKKTNYYHRLVNRWYESMIPEQQTILQITYDNQAIEIPRAQKQYVLSLHPTPSILTSNAACTICKDWQEISNDLLFDYIIVSQINEADDIQDIFEKLKQHCHSRTRIIIDSYSFLWEPILWLAQKIGLRKPSSIRHWLTNYDIKHFLHLADFEVLTTGRFMLIPFYIPIMSWLCNFIGQIPGINRLCLVEWVVGRPKPSKQERKDYSVSVIIPCKNERGNVKQLIERCPNMGTQTEIIFVEGGSSDGTGQEINNCIPKFPEKKITHITQSLKGKKNAVYEGFAQATGDILMILDGDATMPAEELQKFYDSLVSNKGEFINGSRLIYGMESEAMRFLNMLANHFFAVLFSWIIGQPIKDTLCGTKVFFRYEFDALLKSIKPLANRDPFGDFDLLFGAAKLNLKIIDMPVHFKARSYGVTQIRRFYHGLMLLKMSIVGCIFFKLNFLWEKSK